MWRSAHLPPAWSSRKAAGDGGFLSGDREIYGGMSLIMLCDGLAVFSARQSNHARSPARAALSARHGTAAIRPYGARKASP